MQAFFNALCIPATFVLARQIGLTRVGVGCRRRCCSWRCPEFQESAWRFWTDSQATFVILVYLCGAGSPSVAGPSLISGVLGLVCLGLLLLTKESAAVTFTPFLVLAGAIPLSRRLTSSGRMYAALAAVLVLLAFVGFGVLLARAPGDLARSAAAAEDVRRRPADPAQRPRRDPEVCPTTRSSWSR